MTEWVPIILSVCLGICLPITGRRPGSVTLAIAGIFLVAFSAFVMSGEYRLSWTYLLLDLLQAAFGFIVGTAAMRAIRFARSARKAN